MSNHRGFLQRAETVYFVLLLLYTLFCVANAGPYAMTVVQNPEVKYDACGPYKENFKVHCEDEFSGDINMGIVSGNAVAQLSLEHVCSNSNLFCFPSTLPGLLTEEKIAESTALKDCEIRFDATLSLASTQGKSNLTWVSNCDSFRLLNGRVVSCSLNLQEEAHDMSCHQTNSCKQDDAPSFRGSLHDQKSTENENSVKIKSGISDGSSVLHVEVSPLLDWGQQYLYFPSLAFLTVRNTHSDSSLNVYEPYSTSTQFYPCNFSEMTLGPGEVASVCFVFIPTGLGLSSAHLILQTSFGGFLIQARGFAIESPYGIQPLLELDKSSTGRLRKNFSLSNPFDEILYVEEVTAWMSFSSGSTSRLTRATCSMNNLEDSAESSIQGVQKWLGIKSGQVDVPEMAMRPHKKWEVGPHSTETIIELDFHHSQGKIFGAFWIQLLRSSIDKADIIMVPLEAELGSKSTYDLLSNPVSVSLDALLPCDDSVNVLLALSLRNAAPHLLRVVKISAIGESTKIFQFKYVEGLIIFPGTATQVAVVTCAPIASQLHDPPPEVPDMSMKCKLLILTNDSSDPHIEVPCSDIVSICSRHRLDSYIGYDHHPEDAEFDAARTGSVENGMQSHSQIEALVMAEADELVLGNWKSQGTVRGMSVLDDHEVLFPMVEIGTHHPKWITVKNPSHEPVVMQLILNSGEIVDECRDQNGLLQPSSASSLVHNKDTAPTRYGFSIADSAVTEAYVHPYSRAIFGPILFHPSSRCWWKSSALIRNNLSGVEWLSLRGFGGSLSLALFEGSNPVQTIEFKFPLLRSLNFTPPVDNNSNACSQPCLKELYAKNTGDLLVEVNRIEISGTECELDGFLVHTCRGFSLEPGESKKLVISHQTDFSAAMVQRDLQLALATGILVIPMKASFHVSMINFCKRSVLWRRVKKSWVPIIIITSVMFLLFCRILPLVISFGSQAYFFRSGNCSIANIKHQGRSPRVHRNQKGSGKFGLSAKMNSQCVAPEQGATAEPVNSSSGYRDQNKSLLDLQDETTVSPSLISSSVAVESSALQEASQPGNLRVKVVKEKGKRRRKKKGNTAGLAGQFELSSSQSGNSTPSSPLSPVTSSTSRRSRSPDTDQHPAAKNPFACIADRRCENTKGTEIGPTKEMVPAKPVLLASATFPSMDKPTPNLICSSPPPLLVSTSPISPHARAPGSKLGDWRRDEETQQDKKGNEDVFKYDIWGDHLFGLQLPRRSGDQVSGKSRFAVKSNSNSFFLSGPQIPVPNSELTFVGPNQEG